MTLYKANVTNLNINKFLHQFIKFGGNLVLDYLIGQSMLLILLYTIFL